MAYGAELQIEPDPDGGVVHDGGNHHTATGAFYFDVMNFCGCGCASEAVSLVRECLDGPEVKAVVEANPERAAWFILYSLDAWQFTEHGSSVTGGGWLTDRGLQAIAAFKADKDDPDGGQ
jgi:hypothetical protein